MAAAKSKILPGWFSKREMAAYQDVTEQTFDQVYRKIVPEQHVRTIGRKVYFYGRGVVDALIETKVREARASAPTEVVTDPLLAAGADSPGLERYRTARADLAEMERDRLRSSLVPRDQLDPALAKFAGVLRRAGESLQRQFGDDASVILNEAVDEAEAAWEKMLGSSNEPDARDAEADGIAGADPAAPQDARVRRE